MRGNFFHLLAIAALLTGCTNGMLGESAIVASQNNNGTGTGVGSGASSYPTSIPIAVSPTTTYKAFSAGPGAEVGVIANLEPKLVETLTQSVLDNLVSKALADTAAGDIPVIVTIADFKTRLTFPFRMLVKYDGAADKNVLKNVLISNPGKKIAFAVLPNAPVKAPSFQNLNEEIYMVGGKDKDDNDLNQVVMVSVSGNTTRPNTQYPDWGGVGNGSYLLYREDDQPLLLAPAYAASLYNNLVQEVSHTKIVNSVVVADPVVAPEAWHSYIAANGSVNFALVQFYPGRPRTIAVENVQEISFIVVPPGSSGQPERHMWCSTLYDPPQNSLSDSFKQTLHRAGGCTAHADRNNRLTVTQSAINAQAAAKGTVPTTGTQLYSTATTGITVQAIP